MTIQEAIKTEKDFKRPLWKYWARAHSKGIFFTDDFNKSRLTARLTPIDLLAEDWMIREVEMTTETVPEAP